MTKLLVHIIRLLLGIIFLGAGVNGYFVIFGLEPLTETSDEAMALFEFDYLLVFVKSFEVLCGILLLVNRFVPLALAALSPIVANIFLLHVFHGHSLLPLAVVIVIFHCCLLFVYRRNFLLLFEKKPDLFT
ncbi:DoxX protein [Evansella caseinilytica]|uniref:DoxX protein n=1 Tax=Evansella caseinilytica TaxID=1503961 RepID=A0A1H3ING2_9BACI|nr:DoxX family membrane protein [Evansella caseinilytica]SDY29222.1 DoxX protein [Evansella caseinilytica]